MKMPTKMSEISSASPLGIMNYTNFIGNPNLIPEESTSWELGV